MIFFDTYCPFDYFYLTHFHDHLLMDEEENLGDEDTYVPGIIDDSFLAITHYDAWDYYILRYATRFVLTSVDCNYDISIFKAPIVCVFVIPFGILIYFIILYKVISNIYTRNVMSFTTLENMNVSLVSWLRLYFVKKLKIFIYGSNNKT